MVQNFFVTISRTINVLFVLVLISDKPDKPTITADLIGGTEPSQLPEEGDDIELTCSTPTSGVTEYEFMRGSTSLGKSSSATYRITNAQIGTSDGIYTCIAYKNNVPSYPSMPEIVSCKKFIFYLRQDIFLFV